MPVDASIPLQAQAPQADLAAIVSNALQLRQMRQQVQTQNSLKALLNQPDAVDPTTGRVSNNTLAAMARIDPQQALKFTTAYAKADDDAAHRAYSDSQLSKDRAEAGRQVLSDSIGTYDADIAGGTNTDIALRDMRQTLHDHLYSSGIPKDQADQQWAQIGAMTPAQVRALSLSADQRAAAAKTANTVKATLYDPATKTTINQMEDGRLQTTDGKPYVPHGPLETTGEDQRNVMGQERVDQGNERIAQSQQRIKDAEQQAQAGVKLDDDTVSFIAQQVADGQPVPNFGYGKAGAAARAEVFNRAAKLAEQEGGATGAEAGGQAVTTRATIKADTGSLSNLTRVADSAASFEATAKKNFDLALSLAKQGVPTNMGPWMNEWLQNGETALGDPNMPKYAVALLTAANEYAKVMSGSTGSTGSTVDSRQEASKMFAKGYDLDQITPVIRVAEQDMENRRASYDDKLAEIRSRISGEAGGKSAQSAGGISRPNSKAEFDQLPKGAHYSKPGDPPGTYRVKS